MMDDLCAHITDIVANSISAGAKKIMVSIEMSKSRNILSLKITDNGKGMDKKTAEKVIDPFYSTKTGKKVGLGIPLLKGTAETCGGSFKLNSEEGIGTEIDVTFLMDHPDLPPLGKLKDTILISSVSNPETNFSYYIKADDKDFLFDIEEINNILDGLPINDPEVIKFLTKYLDENLEFI
jgi:hypothetical protein